MKTPDGTIPIPKIDDWNKFQRNMEHADNLELDHCPCCGKVLRNPVWFFNSIYGGNAYPANGPAPDSIKDAWVMGVGSECRKRFPAGYVFQG